MHSTDKSMLITVIIVALTIWTALIVLRCIAQAQDKTALHLTQCIRAECGDCNENVREPAAIAWVLYKRLLQYNRNNAHQRTLDDQILAYCALFDKRNRLYKKKRRINLRRSTPQNPLKGAGPVQWWETYYPWTERFVANPESVTDPMPLAMHWDGKKYRKYAEKKGLIRLKVSRFYLNDFYR